MKDLSFDLKSSKKQDVETVFHCNSFQKSPHSRKYLWLKSVINNKKPHLLVWFFVVDDTRLELVTSRTSSGCATSCANRPGGDKRDRTADLLNAIQSRNLFF